MNPDRSFSGHWLALLMYRAKTEGRNRFRVHRMATVAADFLPDLPTNWSRGDA